MSDKKQTNKNESSKHESSWWDVGTIALGFVGGILGSLTIFVVEQAPRALKDHALLSAPFLAFVALIVLLGLFYRPVHELLKRGSLTISWGDKKISIQDIEENFDKEFDSRLETLASEIEDLRQSVKLTSDPLKKESGKIQAASNSHTAGVVDLVRETFQLDSNDLSLLIYHLGTSTYRWRNLQTLAKRTRLSVDKVESLAQRAPQVIVRSRGKSGNIIFRLTESADAQFRGIRFRVS